ncbi:MAG: hypothetical protein IJ867_06250 [Clostridia bacterium]|nr:hypothetical protein [Clostridia bacterium]
MKKETVIAIISILIVGIIVVRFVLPKKDADVDNTTEENKVAYRLDIEDQNFTEINQNIVEPVDTTVQVDNVIDTSDIESLRR